MPTFHLQFYYMYNMYMYIWCTTTQQTYFTPQIWQLFTHCVWTVNAFSYFSAKGFGTCLGERSGVTAQEFTCTHSLLKQAVLFKASSKGCRKWSLWLMGSALMRHKSRKRAFCLVTAHLGKPAYQLSAPFLGQTEKNRYCLTESNM